MKANKVSGIYWHITVAGIKRAGLRSCVYIPRDKPRCGTNSCKPTKTGMFYDPLLAIETIYLFG
jgi:hypothetical protein